MDNNYKTLLFMTLFAGVFLLIGTFAPVLYATYVPASEIIQVDTFEPSDTSVGQESHIICWQRQTDENRAADIRTELILISEKERIEIDRTTRQDIIEKGDKTIRIRMELSDNIKSGEYRYNALITVELANDRVERQFLYQSETFTVYENESVAPNDTILAC